MPPTPTTTTTLTTTTTTTMTTTTMAATTVREIFRKFRSGRRGRFRQQKILEIGAILAIFEPFEVRKFRMPFFGEFGRSSQDLGESDYKSINSWDDRLNSPKSGMWIFGDRNTGHVWLGTQDMSYLEHRKCFAWTTRNVPL